MFAPSVLVEHDAGIVDGNIYLNILFVNFFVPEADQG